LISCTHSWPEGGDREAFSEPEPVTIEGEVLAARLVEDDGDIG
jgi:hypothetical protein